MHLFPRAVDQKLDLDLAKISGGGSCPTQFFGETLDGREVYVRYRGGQLSVDLEDPTQPQEPKPPRKGWIIRPLMPDGSPGAYIVDDEGNRKIVPADSPAAQPKQRGKMIRVFRHVLGKPLHGDISLDQAMALTGMKLQGQAFSHPAPEELYHTKFEDLSGETKSWVFWGRGTSASVLSLSREICAIRDDAQMLTLSGRDDVVELKNAEMAEHRLWISFGWDRPKEIPSFEKSIDVSPASWLLRKGSKRLLSVLLPRFWPTHLLAGGPPIDVEASANLGRTVELMQVESFNLDLSFQREDRDALDLVDRLERFVEERFPSVEFEDLELTSGEIRKRVEPQPISKDAIEWSRGGQDRYIMIQRIGRQDEKWNAWRVV